MEQAGSPHKLTYSDFLLFPEDGLRHELIDGQHYVTPSPAQRHQRILGNLYYPDADVVEVFSRSGEGFHPPVRHARDQILKTPLLPGLAIEIYRIFD